MALTGLQIYKFLPKTNCKKCGLPTCLAFAMALAQKKASLDKCPDIDAAGKQALESASQPPMATLKFGIKDNEIELGGETVLFRHEKTFFHAPALVILLSDSLPEEEFKSKIENIRKMEFERVGMMFGIDAVALKNDSGNAETFAARAAAASEIPLVLISEDIGSVKKARAGISTQRPVVIGADAGNCEEWAKMAQETDCILAVKGKDLEEVAETSQKIQAQGFKNIMLCPKAENMKEALHSLTSSWRLCLKKSYRPLGYPLIGMAGGDIALAANFVCKYAGMVIVETEKYEELLALITLRLNIYTDPQKPLMMEAKLYEVGKPDENSPVIVTTNFSLTFYTVQPEIENSKIPAWLLITDSEGQSVLTAWAADKFNAEVIAQSLQKCGVAEKVKHKKLIIPGYVAVLKAKVEEESGWEVLVGPKEASALPKYLKESWR
ncbi:MAG: acetyl-CoA decarbonylase/synthase complex subunit gamma [Candidatus Omnitrophota bacterium]|nr:acetyl-CoA decarbonylase/synthase complex subunit gamma [Candidatus Omnitrophota bacterium]MBU2528429.1 acetyl-CoA decarbonylase/synthase complex subunit gamma [bacterium]MBU3930782.1 acetyl-CoA decarbonylase/synthase complex subunit gamma [bacterium]MBU4123285.1 acetyl-CoA decarbonylase/synthase complex subunit gamma [bacterium]